MCRSQALKGKIIQEVLAHRHIVCCTKFLVEAAAAGLRSTWQKLQPHVCSSVFTKQQQPRKYAQVVQKGRLAWWGMMVAKV